MSDGHDRRTMVGGALAAGLVALTAGDAGATARSLRARVQAVLDQHLAARRKPEGITCISAHVSRSADDPGISLVTGTTDRSGREPISARTLFEVGSNTKAFTSALLMKLEAAGKLDIDQTLGDWLPQYPAWKHVKIRRLLNMTSGIPTYSEAPRFMRAQAENKFRHFTEEELVAYAYPRPGNHLPVSEGYFYSNTNYVLAGMIAAKAGKEPYDRQLRRLIFKPLRMTESYYDAWKLPKDVIERMASGYFLNPACGEYRPDCSVGPLQPLDGQNMRRADVSWTGPAGGIVSTPRDLTRWVRGLFGGHVVPRAQLAQMKKLVSVRTGKPIAHATAADPQGFGLGVAQLYQPGTGPLWFYEGMTLGYRGVFAYYPKTDVVLAVALNSQPPEGTDAIGALFGSLYAAVMQ
ncbi:MAG: serine hydrolase domain-containing protein [Geminicoccaceae bacterium]